MNNLILFLNSFIHYLYLFLLFGILIVVAVLIGIKVRKSKNLKEEVAQSAANIEAATVKKEES